jgi:hypothetical protein
MFPDAISLHVRMSKNCRLHIPLEQGTGSDRQTHVKSSRWDFPSLVVLLRVSDVLLTESVN